MKTNMIKRHQTFPVTIGSLTIGGQFPIAIQSMTNTPTEEVDATVDQIIQLYQAGAELVRITVNTEGAANSVVKIKNKLKAYQCNVPLIGDFHYNGHKLLEKYSKCAQVLDKYRINPGNVNVKNANNTAFDSIIRFAKKYQKPVRIGGNSGSVSEAFLNQLATKYPSFSEEKLLEEALFQSVIQSAQRAKQLGLAENQMILSCKVTQVPMLIRIYQRLAENSHYALHLGVTESGPGIQGAVSSSIGIGTLLQKGIGDTIRTSITPLPGQSRTEEIKISQAILQSLELRYFKPTLITCPGCGRTNESIFEKLVSDVQHAIDKNMASFKQHPDFHRLKIAIMGCFVNGPGESQHADIGLYLNSNSTTAIVFAQHKKIATLHGNNIADQFIQLLKIFINKSTS